MLRRSKRLSTFALIGFLSALAATTAAVLYGVGYRTGVLNLSDAFTLLRWTAFVGLGAAVVSVIGLLIAVLDSGRKGTVLAVLGLALGFTVFWLPYSQYRAAQSLPPIHDVTTDTQDPPGFKAILALRADAPNAHTYGGPVIAEQQLRAYADIRTARFDVPGNRVFDAALAAAGDMGWKIIAVSPQEGRIEATDTTLWFGFTDDVVIRVRPTDNGTAVDARSLSRVGRSDLGTNAARIRTFLDVLRSRIDTN